MNDMNITTAQYVLGLDGTNSSIQATIDGINMSVPLDLGNRHYAEIMRQEAAGTLVVLAAE